MSQHVILNNVEHKNLTVIDQRQSLVGSQHMCASLSLSEIRSALQDYPILFYGAGDQAPGPMAILGFEKDENLFLNDAGWGGHYIPAIIRKGPFMIGRQQQSNGDVDEVVSIDPDDPRLNQQQGQPLFLPHGGHSEFLTQVLDTLHMLATERESTDSFCQTLQELQLLEPVQIAFNASENKQVQLNGFYTINEEKLNGLSGETLKNLAGQGFLQAAYFCCASLANLSSLIRRKQHNVS